ncbi:hypothetical protein EMCRGX_G012309 [Ephydatia muelleri]
MASLPIGRSLQPFDPQTKAYAERLEQYLLVNDVSDKKKQVEFFLTVVGSSTYQVLRDLLAPDTPASRNFSRDQLVCELIATNIQKRLLSEANLTAERALQAMETVEKGAKDFKEEHQDSKRQETETAAINVCHKCKRVGHLARACRSSGSKKETTHRVTDPQEEQEYRLDYIGVLKGINTKRVWIEVELNGMDLIRANR